MDSTSEIWRAWQGREISADLRLGRYLGGSERSAVFLAGPAAAAVKLVPAAAALAEVQLADWRTAAGLAHPHLLRLLQTGRCELDGRACLYVVMEYAEQNLAQLLTHRPLTEVEALDLLPPALDALRFLHGRNLVQGQLKPANVLAVGDQLKLAVDTVRGVGETGVSRSGMSVYDPPEAREGGSYGTAGDLWGLGLTLVEALTCSLPTLVSEGRGGVVLPRDFPTAFHELVTGCLSRRPHDRPKVTDIEAWLKRRAGAAAPVGAPIAARVGARESAATAAAIEPRPTPPQAAIPQVPGRRSFAVPIAAAAIALGVLGWAGIRALRPHRAPVRPRVEAAPQAPAQAPSPTQTVTGSAAAGHASPAPGQVNAAAAPAVVHAEIPTVPLRARQTIHGHIRVSVRVIVDRSGRVVAALADQPGPSRYFARLAIAAARKWTFPPADTRARRVNAILFEFTRDGTRGHAVPLR